MTSERLLEEAKKARKKSYSPYSHFAVGAALLTADGDLFTGCNVENASYGATCCAERVALFSAIAAGKTDFRALAVVGGKAGKEPVELCPPCGICRQALSEFCPAEMPVYLCDREGLKAFRFGELLPLTFSTKQLENED